IIYPGNEFAHVFREDEPGSGHWVLGWVRYRNRGHLELEYERGRLARVTDTVGRVVVFDHTPEGRIAGISVTTPAAERLAFARYRYDERGNLVAATDADGHTTRYAYGDAHELTVHEYPSGLTFQYKYDRKLRCIETWGEYPGRNDPALAADLPKVLADG